MPSKAIPSGRSGYLPSLDGWRALAIAGVMLTHDRPMNLFGHSTAVYKGYGGYEVYLFFAISGFLITSRILEEEHLTGRFDLRRFYLRRTFRIQPAAWVYLAAVALLMLAGVSRDSWASWVAALLLYVNFIYHPDTLPTLTGHFWTLAVEEHFYLLLSATLYLARRWWRPVVLALLCAAALLPTRVGSARIYAWELYAPRSTQWQIYTLLQAAMVAVLLRYVMPARAVRTVLRPWAALGLTLLVAMTRVGWAQWAGHVRIQPYRNLHSQIAFVAVFLPILWVVATVTHPQSWTTQLLELRAVRFIGKISYSLYLWHIVIYFLWHEWLFSDSGLFAHLQNNWEKSLMERPARVAASILVATLSYYWIEKPMIRLGHRLAPPATPGRAEFVEMASARE